MSRAILDTSVFVARETGRPVGPLPEEVSVSVVTLAELEVGVLLARSADEAVRRLATLREAQQSYAPLPIDEEVALTYAALEAHLRERRRRVHVQDLWIAATARAHDVAVCTQDGDFEDLPGVEVIRV